MGAQRQITGMAEQQLGELQDTYGIEQSVDNWCKELAGRAIPPEPGRSAFDFGDALDQTGEVMKDPEAFLPTDEVELVVRAAKWGLSALNGLRGLIAARRAAGVSVKIESRVFRGLSDGCLRIEVVAIYEVDPKAGTVTFRYFEWFTAGPASSPVSPDEIRKW